MPPCSTPEGVIVWFTRSTIANGPFIKGSQRPKASSSGSRIAGALGGELPAVLNARRRHRLVHPGKPAVYRPPSVVLNSRRRHRLVHTKTEADYQAMNECSTPEGVIVWFTLPP